MQRVKELLEQGAEVDAREDNGDTPVIEAARCGHIIALKMLLDRGANVNAQNNDGDTALMMAGLTSDPTMVRLLLARGANARIKDKHGFTAMTGAQMIGGSTEPEYLKAMALLKKASAPGFNAKSIKEPVLDQSAKPRGLLHRDNVRRLPIARTLEDIYALEEAIQGNRDLEAFAMMRRGRFTMIPNDSEIEVLDTRLLHCQVKVTRTGRIGWVLCDWVTEK